MNKKHLIGYPATFIVAGMITAAGNSGASTASPVPTVTVTGSTVYETVTAPAPTTATVAPKPAAAPKPAPKPALPTTISDGTWEVGVDFAAGKYKSSGAQEGCYWEISVIGATGIDGIIGNDNVSGGRPSVVLKKGNEFKTDAECGTWTKVG